MLSQPMRFAFLTDLHYGYERRGGHKVPLHDPRAFGAAMGFLQDFKPEVLILGGDVLDCAVVSHHNHGKPGRTEGMRLVADAAECREKVIKPLERLGAKQRVFITGNHEDWLNDLTDDQPGLTGLVDLDTLLGLDKWKVLPQGGYFNLGKLTFIHGDQLGGGEHIAKAAVIAYERSVRFGHHHTFQVYTKTSSLDTKLGRTGIAVPCLCHRDPGYAGKRPNRWVQGLNWGHVESDGTYADYVSVITNGRLVGPTGKVYRG